MKKDEYTMDYLRELHDKIKAHKFKNELTTISDHIIYELAKDYANLWHEISACVYWVYSDMYGRHDELMLAFGHDMNASIMRFLGYYHERYNEKWQEWVKEDGYSYDENYRDNYMFHLENCLSVIHYFIDTKICDSCYVLSKGKSVRYTRK